MKYSGLPHPGWNKIIVALQKKAGMRQQEIAAEVEISQGAISELKSGIRTSLFSEAGMRLYTLYADRVLGARLRLQYRQGRDPAR